MREPRIAGRVKQIVAMGGGYFEQGNVTPAAEFNIYVDPHAARLVFDSGIPITLIPLDCTHQALTTQKRVEAFRSMANASGPATAAMLDFFERFDENKYGTDGGPLHDPCVIAWLLKPELFYGPAGQCRHRMRIRTHHGCHGRRLVARDQAPARTRR